MVRCFYSKCSNTFSWKKTCNSQVIVEKKTEDERSERSERSMGVAYVFDINIINIF